MRVLIIFFITYVGAINSLKAQLDISTDSIHSIFNGKYTEILIVDSIDKFVRDTILSDSEIHEINWFCSIKKLNKRRHSAYQRLVRLFISHVIEFDNYIMVFYSTASRSLPRKGFYLFNKTSKKYGLYTVRYTIKTPKGTAELLNYLKECEYYNALK